MNIELTGIDDRGGFSAQGRQTGAFGLDVGSDVLAQQGVPPAGLGEAPENDLAWCIEKEYVDGMARCAQIGEHA